MRIRCEGMAVLYTPLGTPLELLGIRVSTINLLSIGGRLTFDLAGWNSYYVMKARRDGEQFYHRENSCEWPG